MWEYVIPHFKGFHNKLELNEVDHTDALGKAYRVSKCLFRKYYPGFSDDLNSLLKCVILTGSYGKQTAIRPTSDVDMLFILPYEKRHQFDAHQGNGQSNLLYEIRQTLLGTYPQTNISGDGQVVCVNFNSYNFEIAPAFRESDGSFLICDTNNGGRWKPTHPQAELNMIQLADSISSGSARALIKYIKGWKRYKGVKIKSIAIEVIATQFIEQWRHLNDSNTIMSPFWWHDWMVRDFFFYLLNFDRVIIPGLSEIIPIGENWTAACIEAYREAVSACEYEHRDMPINAETHWKKIFGSAFPSSAPSALSLNLTRQALLGRI